MLLREDDHRIVKNKYVVQTSLLRTLAFVMYDAGFREIIILISSLNNPPRKIYIFSIHEECFI